MSNTGEFYDHTTFPITRSTGSSAGMRQELDLIEAGFNKLPPLSGQGLRLVKIDAAGSGMDVSGLYETAGNQLLYGTSASRLTGGVAAALQIESNSPTARLSVFRNSADVNGGVVVIGKSRGSTVGSSTIVQSGDILGQIQFVAADGVDADTVGAYIQAAVDGTPGANDMPTRLEFYTTPDGSATGVVRVQISNAGLMGVGGAAANRKIELHDASRAIARVQATQTTGSDALCGFEFWAWDGATVTTGATVFYSYSLQSSDPNTLTINNTRNAGIVFKTNNVDAVRVDATGNTTLTKTGGALGYGTGAGGTVTQLTSKSTGVTLNRPSGQITMNGAALAANTAVGFTLTNSVIGTTDVVYACIDSGATAGAYSVTVDAVGAGSCQISVRNNTAGSLSEAIVLNFVVLRAATA